MSAPIAETEAARLSVQSKIDEIELRRAARRERAKEARAAQYLIDVAAVEELEEEYGEDNLVKLSIPLTPGLPVLIVGRKPKASELKRYRARMKGKNPDPVAASEELATIVRVYPSAELYAKILEERPGVHVQLGVLSLELSVAQNETEGKG